MTSKILTYSVICTMFKKKKEKKKRIAKMVKGLIIGGAIGSVLGVTLAPKKGKETRDALIKSGKIAYDKGSDLFQKYGNNQKSNPKTEVHSFFRGIRALVFGKKKK